MQCNKLVLILCEYDIVERKTCKVKFLLLLYAKVFHKNISDDNE